MYILNKAVFIIWSSECLLLFININNCTYGTPSTNLSARIISFPLYLSKCWDAILYGFLVFIINVEHCNLDFFVTWAAILSHMLPCRVLEPCSPPPTPSAFCKLLYIPGSFCGDVHALCSVNSILIVTGNYAKTTWICSENSYTILT